MAHNYGISIIEQTVVEALRKQDISKCVLSHSLMSKWCYIITINVLSWNSAVSFKCLFHTQNTHNNLDT